MKIIKNIFYYSTISIVVLLCVLVYLGYLPVVIVNSAEQSNTVYSCQKGDTLSPFAEFNFDEGKWEAIVEISYDDLNVLDKSIPRVTCLQTNNVEVLQRMKEKWRFFVTGGDLATVTSGFYLIKDGVLVFESGIVIDKRIEGFQSSKFGWITTVDGYNIANDIKQFNRVWSIIKFI
jgi:hypothetical protein